PRILECPFVIRQCEHEPKLGDDATEECVETLTAQQGDDSLVEAQTPGPHIAPLPFRLGLFRRSDYVMNGSQQVIAGERALLDRDQFEHAAYAVDVIYISRRERLDDIAPVANIDDEIFRSKLAHGLAPRIARRAVLRCNVRFHQRRSGYDDSGNDLLTQASGDD